jgi:MFS family permease
MWTRTRLVVACCYGVTGFLNALWGATLPATDARLDLGTGRLGLLLLVVGVGAMAAMPVAGGLAERFSGRALQRVVMPLYALSLAGPAAAGSFPALIVAAAVLSVLLGLLNVALTLQAVDLERAEQQPVMASLHGIWALGALAGGGATAAALRAGADVRLIMVTGALAAGAVALVCGRFLPATAPAVPRPADATEGVAPRGARIGLLLMLGLIGAAAFLTEGAATDWAGIHATRVLGADPATASLAYTAFFAAMTGVRLLGDPLRTRAGAPRVVLITSLAAATGYAAVLLTPVLGAGGVPVALAGWMLAGAGMALIWPIVSSAVGAAFPGRAKGLAVVTTLSYGGGLIGPAVIGFVATRASLPVAMLIPASLVLVVAVIAPRVLAALAAVPQPASVAHLGAHSRAI